jgi:hypothetical protein
MRRYRRPASRPQSAEFRIESGMFGESRPNQWPSRTCRAVQVTIQDLGSIGEDGGIIDDMTWAAQESVISWIAHEQGFIGYLEVYGSMLHPGFLKGLKRIMAEERSPEVVLASRQSASAIPLQRSRDI